MRKGRTDERTSSSRRGQTWGLDNVLKVVNGEAPNVHDYEPARSEIRAALDKAIDYCDRTENLLADTSRPLRDRVEECVSNSKDLYRIWELPGQRRRKFRVQIAPRTLENYVRLSRAMLPAPELLFKLERLLMVPLGDSREQLYWDFYHGVIQLPDLRLIRRCSHHSLHEEAFYFLRQRIDRRENYFCSDQCRSAFNYDELIKREERNGRKRSRKG